MCAAVCLQNCKRGVAGDKQHKANWGAPVAVAAHIISDMQARTRHTHTTTRTRTHTRTDPLSRASRPSITAIRSGCLLEAASPRGACVRKAVRMQPSGPCKADGKPRPAHRTRAAAVRRRTCRKKVSVCVYAPACLCVCVCAARVTGACVYTALTSVDGSASFRWPSRMTSV